MIKAVLFDLDGTLANSLLDLASSVNFALKKHGFEKQEVDSFRYFAGDGMPKMIERALPKSHRGKEDIAKVLGFFLEYYGKHYCDNTTAYSGVPELIEELKLRGIKVGVVTNKAQEMAERVVKKLYGESFSIIFGKREGIPAKPDPTAALITMSELGVNPQECIFVGDSGADVKTGVNSGAYPVGVLWGFREKDELISNGAKSIISMPNQLIEIIDKLNIEVQKMKKSDYLNWDEYFMGLAVLSSMRSKDPSTQVGACIVDKDNKIVSVGYNGMPHCCSDDVFPWERGEGLQSKYLYVCHAELNAILNCHYGSVKGCTLYSTLFPCNECAKAIIQSGIREVVYMSDKYSDTDGVKASKRMFESAGISFREHKFTGKKISFDL